MTPLPLRELLGTLIADLIEAEAHSAQATVDFLRAAGFVDKNKSPDHWGEVRFIQFSFTVPDMKEGAKVRTIRVPLLSLLPIPLQQVEQAEYELFARVIDVKQNASEAKGEASSGSKIYSRAPSNVDLLCDVAPYCAESVPGKKPSDPTIRVKITMRQSDLPAGLASSLRRIEETSGNSLPDIKQK